MAQVAQPFFDGDTKFGKVHFRSCHSDHKRLWGDNEVSNLSPTQNSFFVRQPGYRRRPGRRLVLKKRLLLGALTLRQSVAIVANWRQQNFSVAEMKTRLVLEQPFAVSLSDTTENIAQDYLFQGSVAAQRDPPQRLGAVVIGVAFSYDRSVVANRGS